MNIFTIKNYATRKRIECVIPASGMPGDASLSVWQLHFAPLSLNSTRHTAVFPDAMDIFQGCHHVTVSERNGEFPCIHFSLSISLHSLQLYCSNCYGHGPIKIFANITFISNFIDIFIFVIFCFSKRLLKFLDPFTSILRNLKYSQIL